MFCNIFDSRPKQSPLSLLCSTHSKHYLHTSLSLSLQLLRSQTLSSEISLFLSLLSTVESSPPSCRFQSPLQLLRSQTLYPQRSLSSSPSSPLSLRFHHRIISTVASPLISTDSNYST
ncbi:hypothetical protein CsSME_00031853 [Camellia sinensis var. sinensis]